MDRCSTCSAIDVPRHTNACVWVTRTRARKSRMSVEIAPRPLARAAAASLQKVGRDEHQVGGYAGVTPAGCASTGASPYPTTALTVTARHRRPSPLITRRDRSLKSTRSDASSSAFCIAARSHDSAAGGGPRSRTPLIGQQRTHRRPLERGPSGCFSSRLIQDDDWVHSGRASGR